jgi:EAL domain-containing protein (putative c-di-GMP-specific phosphodiesterase class I)
LRSGKLVGAEALLRWRHATLGDISPAAFIPIAEESGLMPQLWQFLTRTVFQAQQQFPVNVALNVSMVQLTDRRFVDELLWLMAEYALQPGCITLEITETLSLDVFQQAPEILAELHKSGFSLAIDDFGTGYSSLSALNALPVDKLKIDKKFIDQMLENPESATIVNAIIQMGHAMGLIVVAEGIETEAQMEYLREAECDVGQGYYFSPAMEIPAFIEHWR